jgi:phytol kinase
MSETFRQTVHLLMGVLGAAVILRLDDQGALVFVSAVLVATFLLCDAFTRGYDLPVLSGVMDEAERRGKVPLKGGIAYAIGALFCLAVFGREYTAVGLVTLGLLDSVSTIAGLRFGRYILRGGKSLEGTLTELRRDSIGFIFQKFNLIPVLTAQENVEYPYIVKNQRRDDGGRAAALLERVGIDASHATHTPNELSGGQQQRVAVARALINDPAILLCDEPTGNLDSATSVQIMELLAELNHGGKTVVMVTHDPSTATYANRVIRIRDGRIEDS